MQVEFTGFNKQDTDRNAELFRDNSSPSDTTPFMSTPIAETVASTKNSNLSEIDTTKQFQAAVQNEAQQPTQEAVIRETPVFTSASTYG